MDNNYGDVALNLSADWSRYKEANQEYALGIVGHENGVADVRLEDEPSKRHQFAFVDTRYKDEIDLNRIKKYVFVKKTEGWVKNENLWEWDAEGFLVHKGQRLMARPVEFFDAEMKQRAERHNVSQARADKEAREIAARAGIEMEEEGRRVTKRRSARA